MCECCCDVQKETPSMGCCHGFGSFNRSRDRHTSWRRFVSKEERKESLEKYKEELEKELKAINERLEEL